MVEGSEGVHEEEGDWFFKGSICGSNILINFPSRNERMIIGKETVKGEKIIWRMDGGSYPMHRSGWSYFTLFYFPYFTLDSILIMIMIMYVYNN